jgi:hypothetical protein
VFWPISPENVSISFWPLLSLKVITSLAWQTSLRNKKIEINKKTIFFIIKG